MVARYFQYSTFMSEEVDETAVGLARGKRFSDVKSAQRLTDGKISEK